VADMATLLLQARGVRACYESVEVLHGVDLRIEEHSVTAVLGPNGAGKSTLLSVLAGLNHLSAGEVLFDGKPVKAGTGHSLVRAGLCLIPEGKGIFPNLSVQENLWMMTHRGTSRRQVEERAFGRFPQLSSRRSQAAGTLSGGEQQMLALAPVLVSPPPIVVADEPTLGLAPRVISAVMEVFEELRDHGTAILLVEEKARDVLEIAERVAFLDLGHIVWSGPRRDIDDERLVATYLGASRH